MRRLKAVFIILTVLYVLALRSARINLTFLFPWVGDLLVTLLFIGIAVAGIMFLFGMLAKRTSIIERKVTDISEEHKLLLRTKEELGEKINFLLQKIEELSTLHRIIRAMNQTMDLNKILNVILESICKYLFYDRAILCLIDEKKGIIEAKHAINVNPDYLREISIPLNLADNFIAKIVADRLPVIVDRVTGNLNVFKRYPRDENILAVVPLEAKEKVIGVLIVDNINNKRRLGEKDLRALQTFTSQAAVAVENARLYQTEINFKEELQKQVEIAIEKLKQAQDQLIQSEKLAALGQMAAVVTHEVRNPLSTIRGSAEIISRKAGPDSPLKKYTEYIIQEVERLDLVVTEILTFSRKPQLTLSKENINKLLVQTLDFLEESDFTKYKVSYEKELSEKAPDTFLDRDQIKQVLLNIIQNACHFMEKMPERRLLVKTRAGDNHIYIDISDTGPGIPPENLEKIFEPFFTTKVRGTGLGLSICKNIVESHMGSLKVASEVNKGSTFTLVLPILKK